MVVLLAFFSPLLVFGHGVFPIVFGGWGGEVNPCDVVNFLISFPIFFVAFCQDFGHGAAEGVGDEPERFRDVVGLG